MFKKNIFIVATCIFSINIHSQQAIAVSGGDFFDTNGSVSFTLGQIFFQTLSNENIILNQGIQQSYEIYTLDAEKFSTPLLLEVFPNPTLNNLILQIPDYNNERFIYNLYSLNGRLIESKNVSTKQTLIPTSHLSSGIYILKIYYENKPIHSFKIIKK